MIDDIKITSGYNFEGYIIEDYIGYYTGEIVLGTGFISDLGAVMSDAFGIESNLYADKLEYAKNAAIKKLLEKVSNTSTNAIIGFDIDYTIFSRDLIGVIANGTGVKIKRIEKVTGGFSKGFYVKNYSTEISVRPYFLNIDMNEHNQVFVKMDIYNYNHSVVTAINTDIEFETVFNEKVCIKDASFVDLSADESIIHTERVQIPVDYNCLKIIKNLYVTTNKYIADGNIITATVPHKIVVLPDADFEKNKYLFGVDAVTLFSECNDKWTCICGTINNPTSENCSLCNRSRKKTVSFDQILEKASSLSSVSEIVDYLSEYNKNFENKRISELIEAINEIKDLERLYGNMKRSALQKIKEFSNV